MSEQQPKTVRVRIAVAVDSDGYWAASGYSWCPMDELVGAIDQDMLDVLSVHSRRFYIEADLPIPQIATVAGSVEEVGDE